MFGGRILSLGRLTVPAFDPYAAFPDLFVFLKNGAMTGMDWIGGQIRGPSVSSAASVDI